MFSLSDCIAKHSPRASLQIQDVPVQWTMSTTRFLEFDKKRCVSIKLSHVQWPVTAGHMWGGVTDVWMWHFFRHIIASVTLFPSQLSICDTSLVTCGYLWPIGLSNLRHWQNLEHGNCVTILHYGKFEDFLWILHLKKINQQKRCVTS